MHFIVILFVGFQLKLFWGGENPAEFKILLKNTVTFKSTPPYLDAQ